LALIEGCKHSLEITVPAAEMMHEQEHVLADLAQKVKLPGFRPGKVPVSIVKSRFAGALRQEVVDHVLPKAFDREAKKDQLKVVGQPNVVELKWEEGQDLWFKIEFEVEPEFELGNYTELTVKYDEATVTDEDVDKRIEELREQKADYINLDPRPVVEGDYAVVNLKSLEGTEQPVEREDLMLKVGDADALKEFNENLVGMSPGDSKEFEVTYPDNYAEENLAGKKVKFHLTLTAVRKKELPELNDEFASDLGDFKTMDELKDAVRGAIRRERENKAKNDAKVQILDKLVEMHQFAVPEVFVERQGRMNLEQQLMTLAQQGIDPRQLNLDWNQIKESGKEKAARDVRASLILSHIADRESIDTMRDELDKEVQRIARQRREAAAKVRQDLEKDGSLGRIAGQIRTEKVLNFLFDKARKEAS
jgi:trigger factor